MMVLVHKPIDTAKMQKTVKQGVEEVIHHIQHNKRAEGIHQRHLLHTQTVTSVIAIRYERDQLLIMIAIKHLPFIHS